MWVTFSMWYKIVLVSTDPGLSQGETDAKLPMAMTGQHAPGLHGCA